MRKVMLVIDEYSEMIGLESFLKRLGFDVLSLAKEMFVNDTLLSFQPEIAILSFKGRNVDGLRIAQKLKKTMVPPPRVALAYSGLTPQIPEELRRMVDALIEIPVEPSSVIQMMAQLSGLAAEPILEKYAKVSTAVLTHDEKSILITGPAPKAPTNTMVKSQAPARVNAQADAQANAQTDAQDWDPKSRPGEAATARSERSNRYAQLLATHLDEKIDKVLPHDKAAKAMAKLKKDSESDKEKLDRIEAEKQAFAKALFETGKEKKK